MSLGGPSASASGMSRAAEARARAEAAAAAALAAAAAAETALAEAEAQEEAEAATAIQAAVRGALERRRTARRIAAIVTVQSYVRRWRARRAARLQKERRDAAAAAAAVKAVQTAVLAEVDSSVREWVMVGTPSALPPCTARPGRVGEVHTPDVSRFETQSGDTQGVGRSVIGAGSDPADQSPSLAPGSKTPGTPALASMTDALQQLRLAQAALDGADGGEQQGAGTTTTVAVDSSSEAIALRAEVAALRAALGTATASPAGEAAGNASAAPRAGVSVFQSRRAAAEAGVASARAAGATAAAAALRARAEAAEAALAAASVRGPFGVPTATLSAGEDNGGSTTPTASITLRRCSDAYGQYLTADAPDSLRDGYLLAPADVGVLRAQMAALHRAALSRANVDAGLAAMAASAKPASATASPGKRPNSSRMQQLEARVLEAQNKVVAMAKAAEQRRIEREEKEKRKVAATDSPSGAAPPPPPPPATSPVPDASSSSSSSSSMVSSLSVPLLFASSPVMSLSTHALTAKLDALLLAFSAWSTAALQPAALPVALEAQLKQWSEAVNGALAAAAATVSSVELPVMPTLTDEYLLSLIHLPATSSVFGAGISADDWETALKDVPFSGAATVRDDHVSAAEHADAAQQQEQQAGEDSSWDAVWEEKASGGDRTNKVLRPSLFEATDGVVSPARRREPPRVRINNTFSVPPPRGEAAKVEEVAVVDAAQLRAETEAERLKTVRKLQAAAAEKARRAAAAMERDEAVAGETGF